MSSELSLLASPCFGVSALLNSDYIGVLDGQYLILLLTLQHSGMANTKIKQKFYLYYKMSRPALGSNPSPLLNEYLGARPLGV